MNAASHLSQPVSARGEFQAYLANYRDKLRELFHVQADFDKLSVQRGLPPWMMREILGANPMASFIPDSYGGRGGHIHEGLAVLAASSYESLALSLAFGINWALFLQPVAKYAQEDVKDSIFQRFLKEHNMGGLMITEPDYGTDALSMQTAYVEKNEHYHIQGLKHWGGLTGMADYWLITARERNGNNQLKRDIDFFICDVRSPEQEIEVEEYFENLGLYLIPYGRNRINVEVPKAQKLEPETTGIKMMLDTLHRSRTQFPGMGMGFLKRLLDEALDHCKQRYVGGRSLFNYDQVQNRLAKLQASFTVCSAMCAFSSDYSHLENDLSKNNLSANVIKSVLTDMMQSASQSLLQLVGAKGFRLDHIAGRATVDSRPFQIFEGSNDILYQQISESILKLMRRSKERNLYNYLSTHELAGRAADYFKDALNFEVDLKMPQRKLVELGRVLGRVVSMEYVLKLGDRGFRSDLIANCLSQLKHSVDGLLSTYKSGIDTTVVDEYADGSSWLNLVLPKPA